LEGFSADNVAHAGGIATVIEALLHESAVDLSAEEQAFAEQMSAANAARDTRRRVLVAIVCGQWEGVFRRQLLLAYEGRCAVTGCDVEVALEAAPIEPYQGPHSNDIANGLLLRADVHPLFDLGYLILATAQ
jgi:predicted restriction endonuclease